MTTQVTGTYADIYDWENLYWAYRKAAKGKRGKRAAASFEFKLEDNLWALHDELAAETYEPSVYTHFTIHEPKRRLISASLFRDRVVHHAICRVIEPAFERSFLPCSFANREGKGTHRALDRCHQLSQHHQFVLTCDIQQFFPAIDLRILQRILNRHIQDRQIRRLIAKILESGVGVLSGEYDLRTFPGDDLFVAARKRGLPIGNLTSQFWANCYMNELDYFILRDLSCRAYLRFVDDFALFSDSKEELWGWREAIIQRLATRLRLTLHEHKAVVQPTSEGIPFLGFIVFPTHRLLKRRKGIAYRRKLRAMLDKGVDRATLQASLQGWINHARYGDTWGLRRAIVNELRTYPKSKTT